jgi:uncharacterized protein (DUF1810 family)
MTNSNNLERFIDAQLSVYPTAFSEVKNGRKQSHWMWFIFPQIKGLGLTETSMFYGIKDLNEANEYLSHPVLGSRLIEISNELLKLPGSDARQIFGTPDDLKLKSSMTLFAAIPNTNPIFEQVLEKFYGGTVDQKTLTILNSLN